MFLPRLEYEYALVARPAWDRDICYIGVFLVVVARDEFSFERSTVCLLPQSQYLTRMPADLRIFSGNLLVGM